MSAAKHVCKRASDGLYRYRDCWIVRLCRIWKVSQPGNDEIPGDGTPFATLREAKRHIDRIHDEHDRENR